MKRDARECIVTYFLEGFLYKRARGVFNTTPRSIEIHKRAEFQARHLFHGSAYGLDIDQFVDKMMLSSLDVMRQVHRELIMTIRSRCRTLANAFLERRRKYSTKISHCLTKLFDRDHVAGKKHVTFTGHGTSLSPRVFLLFLLNDRFRNKSPPR